MTTRRLTAAVLAATLLAPAGTALADMKTEWVEYSHGPTKLKSYLVYDAKVAGKRPAVFLVHRRNGMDENTLKSANLYARFGYAVFAVDMFGYGQGVLPKTVPEMTAQIMIYYKDLPLMRARAQAGLDALTKNPMIDTSKIALIGYCFGGTVGVELAYAGAPLAAMISIHGSFREHYSAAARPQSARTAGLRHPWARIDRGSPGSCDQPADQTGQPRTPRRPWSCRPQRHHP